MYSYRIAVLFWVDIASRPVQYFTYNFMLLSSAQKGNPLLCSINIIPITTAITQQFIYNFIIFNV